MKKMYTVPWGLSRFYWTKSPALLLQGLLSFLVISCWLSTDLSAQSQTFNSSGTFIVPTGVTSITVQAIGAGGGGASGGGANRAGGGGGAFATSTFAVTPGTSYTVTVGAGGAPGVAGGSSSFGIVVVAPGGNQGAGLSAGLGGQASAATPTLGAFSGGNGGSSTNVGGIGNQDAGGGGGGAATASNNGRSGGNGSTSAAGVGGLAGGGAGTGGGAGGAGDGGNGAIGPLSTGQSGFAPGGGGGGRAENLTSLGAGSGANGQVTVSWACGLVVSNFVVAVTDPVCEDGPATVVLSSNTVPDGTYSVVYSVSGANTSSNNNTTVTFAGGTGSFTTGNLNNDGNTTITVNLLGCAVPSNNTDSFVVDDGPPQPGTISGGTSVCDNTPGLVYSVAPVAGATGYTWTVPAGWQITAGQGTASITVTSGALFQGGAITVIATNTCGASAPRVLAVLPNANNIGFFVAVLNEVTLCEDEVDDPLVLLTDNLEGGDPSGGQTYAWEVSTTSPAGPFAAGANAGEADDQVYNNVLNDYNDPGTYYFRRIITNNAFCGTADTSMIITLNIDSDIESFSYDPDSVTYCTNTEITPLTPTIVGGVGATFSITPALPAGLEFDEETGVISGTPTAASAAAFYTITAENDCNEATTFVYLEVAPTPTITITGPDDSCEGDGSTLTVTVTVTGGTGPYTISFDHTRTYVGPNCEPLATGPAGIVVDEDGIFTVDFTGAGPGTYVFGASVTDANGCSATGTDVEFVIGTEPVGAALAKTIYSCNRVNVDLQGQIECNLPSTFSWYSVASVGSSVAYNNPNVDGETFAAPGTTATINDLLTNTSTVSQVIIYRVVPTSVGGGCVGEPFYITITVLAPTEPACLACMSEVNVSLDANCRFEVLPNHVIDFGRCENGEVLREALEVVISGSNSNIITCAGTYTYVVKLRAEYERCFRFTPCWGKITAEDKTPPALICPPADFTLDCYDVNYVLNNRLTIGNVGGTASPRPAATGNQTIINAEGMLNGSAPFDNCGLNLVPPGLVADNIKNLGYAYFRDNCRECGCRVTLKWSDKVVFYSCDQMRTNGGIYATISREWVATDCKGMSTSYVQKIHFTRPDLDDFVFNGPGEGKYDRVVEYNSCTPDKSVIKKEDVTPYICSYFNTSANPRCLFIDQVECNYSISIKDTEFPICGGKGVKIDREIYVFDWCSGGIIDTFHVLIKIGDFQAPTVEYAHGAPYDISTGPMDCTAAIPVTVAGIKSGFGVTIKDNCALGNVSVSVYTKDRYVKGILVYEGPENPICQVARRGGELRGDHLDYQLGACDKDEICWDKVDYAVMNGMMIGLPVGKHLMVIDAFDGCYNTSTTCFIFEVKDKIAPVMKCDDDLHVTLSNANGYTSGYAQVSAEDIDEGSWDNCKLAWIAVRRNVPDACAASFIVKGYDTNGNGKLDPLPADGDYTKADGFDRNGDGDIADFGETFILKGGKLMTPLADFVEFFCCDLTERVTVELWGEDVYGNSNYCWMDLLIEDKVAPTCIAPWDITIYCDDKGIAQIDDKIASANIFGDVTITSGNDCGVLDTTYATTKSLKCGVGYIDRIWTLTKQTVKGPITITCKQRISILPVHEYNICFPKDVSTDCKTPVIDTVVTDELACDILAVNVSDKRYDASDDECYKLFRTYTVINWCVYDDRCGDPMAEGNVYVVDRATFGNYGKAPLYVLVRDANRDQNEEFYLSKDLIAKNADDIQFTPPYCQVAGEYYHSFMYTQIIKVYDDVRPVVTGPAAEFCIREGGDCLANIKMVVNATDNCTDQITLETQYLMIAPNQTTDAGKMILYSTPRWSTKDLGNGQFEINVANLPVGTHDLIVVVRDECGNLSVATRIPFTVKDCKGPAPICINGLSTELMPDGNNGGMMAVWASDFVASKIYDCYGQGPETLNGLKLVTKYSINRVGEPVVATQTGINLTCADKGKVVLVELHAWDEAGNHDFCVTYVEVQDNRAVCPGSATGDVSIAGTISTEGAGNLQGASITLSGAASQSANTNATGGYSFINLTKGGDFTVTPQLDKNHLNGVSTFDLVLIQKHILGVQALNSPYKMIAADVNNSKSISTLDLIALRKLILNIDSHFANNTSWRFVDAGYNFPNANNPWATSFPEVVSINDIAANATANFIAIKVGDVNASATVSAAAAAEVRTFGTLNINAAEAALKAGQEVSVEFNAADLKDVQGYQFALNLDKSKVELVDIVYGVAKAENFGVFQNEGIITTSWNGEFKQGALFTLVLRAKADAQLSSALSLNRVVAPEAYNQSNEQLGIALQFGKTEVLAAGFELKQNTPNPFNAETVISFNLPKAMAATLTISDVTGRVLKTNRADYAKGLNQVTLKAAELNASGVLYYTLEADEYTATKKMIIVE